jgi:hypothetical protein
VTRADTAWVKSRIETVPSLVNGASTAPANATKVFVTQAIYPYPNTNVKVLPPYVIIDPDEGDDEARRYTGPKNVRNPRFTIRIIGATADQVQFFFEKIKAVFIGDGFGVYPMIPDEVTERVWLESPTPIGLDPDVTPPLVLGYIRLGWSSQPA